MTRLVFLGPPGAGKGTQADRLKAEFTLTHLATGDLLREAVAQGTDLGREAKRYMDAGDLVPDAVVIGMIRERLSPGADNFLLDGFPRTIAQAQALDQMLGELDAPLDAVLALDVSREELVRRLAGRWICRTCSRSWHEVFAPHVRDDACVAVGECDLYQRPDDRADAVENRLTVYAESTEPLIAYYAERGLLRAINGEQSQEQVYGQIASAVTGN